MADDTLRGLPYVVTYDDLPTTTPIPAPDIIAGLPDDERRIVLAWRRMRSSSEHGAAVLSAVMLNGHLYLFDGSPGGKVLLRET